MALSNIPTQRSATYDTALMAGVTGPGWEVDIERDGELIAGDLVARDGRYAFRIPVSYGATTYTVVTYDPFGNVHRTKRFIVVRDELLPPRVAEYFVVAGQSERRSGVEVRIRYAPMRRMTVGAGFSTMSPVFVPGLSIATCVTHAVSIVGESWPQRSSRIGVQYVPSPGASAAIVWNDSVVSYAMRWGAYREAVVASLFVDGTVRSGRGVRTTPAMRAGVAIENRFGRLAPFVQHQASVHRERVVGGGDVWVPFGRVAVFSAHLTGIGERASLVETRVSTHVSRIGRVELRSTWQGRGGRPLIGWALGRALSYASIRSSGERSSGGIHRTTYDIDGSFTVDPLARQLTASPTSASADAFTTWR